MNPVSGKQKAEAGFALLITIIFMTVMLSLGLSLGAIGYKQTLLASSAIESQYAFYAADAALECTLYADQQQDLFNHEAHSPGHITCDNPASPSTRIDYSYNANMLMVKERLSLDAGTRCADVTIFKYQDLHAKFFSQGYNVPCAVVAAPGNTRFVSRGMKSSY